MTGYSMFPSSSKTGASPSAGLMLYTGKTMGEFNPSVEMQSVYSTAPADWTSTILKEIQFTKG